MTNFSFLSSRSAFIFVLFLGPLLALFSCGQDNSGPLPYYGFHDEDATTGDTIYHQIRDFSFVDQDSQIITNDYFDDKIYIADFFFTSCPTICPKVKAQMLRIYEKYEDNDQVALLSHTIDVKRDTVGKLKKYAIGLGTDTPKWRFVTGDRDSIYSITYDYISTALEAPEVPGGFDHSGWVLLIDKDRHLRAYADGTKEEKVDEFMKQIDRLLAEYESPKGEK